MITHCLAHATLPGYVTGSRRATFRANLIAARATKRRAKSLVAAASVTGDRHAYNSGDSRPVSGNRHDRHASVVELAKYPLQPYKSLDNATLHDRIQAVRDRLGKQLVISAITINKTK